MKTTSKRASLAARRKSERYRLRTMSLGGVRQGVDLDKALAMADSLEDQELARKTKAKK